MYDILERTAEVFNLQPQTILDFSRKAYIVDARKAFVYCTLLLRPETSKINISRFLKRNHATIINLNTKATYLMQYEKGFKEKVNIILKYNYKHDEKKIVYIAHPISGNIKGNIEKLLNIIKDINLNYNNTIPFAPYIADVLALDDNDIKQREIGISNNVSYFKSGIIKEVWVYGDYISNGVFHEIELAKKLNIPVIFKNNLKNDCSKN